MGNSDKTAAMSGLAFTDMFPSGMVVATPNGLSGSCGDGTITATASTNIVSLSGATLAAKANCHFSVKVAHGDFRRLPERHFCAYLGQRRIRGGGIGDADRD